MRLSFSVASVCGRLLPQMLTLVLVLVLVLVQLPAAHLLGDPCLWREQQETCVPLVDCPPLLSLLSSDSDFNHDYVRNATCGSVEIEADVILLKVYFVVVVFVVIKK